MSKVEVNKQYAVLLGWTPAQFGATAIDNALIEAVTTFQRSHALDDDGVAGPDTCARLVEVLFAREQATPSDDVVRTGGRLALLEAKRRWLSKIIDPLDDQAIWAGSRAQIDDFIRSKDGLGWSWERPYVQNGDYEWCGAFAGNAWRAGGIRLELRYTYFASTYRLDRFARYLPVSEHVANPKPADAGARRKIIDLDEDSGPLDAMFASDDPPREGDLLLLGTAKKAYGHHVCLVESYDLATGMFTTIEGNGTGRWPNGKKIHGVIRAQRPVGTPDGGPARDHVRRLIRPGVLDF